MTWFWVVLPGALLWSAILMLPWAPWRTREVLESSEQRTAADLSEIAVLIPARNEAQTLPVTLGAPARQGVGVGVMFVADQSVDGTAPAARNMLDQRGRLVSGTAPPAGWSGKLWALEQARAHVHTPLLLLLDADIELDAGIIPALAMKLRRDRLSLVSLLARLRTESFWEKLLLPAFVYFFKLLYPFRLANDVRYPRVAAAAGGCILLEARVLDEIGGFGALHDALIDDCTLAARVK